MKRKRITRSALAASILMILLWLLFGTASTVAWFSDSDTVVNTFVFGEVSAELFYKTDNGYEPVTSQTKLFRDEALYEPGYTQRIYLKVKNAGSVPFDYRLSVITSDTVVGENALGKSINLPDHLRFGAVIRNTEAEILAAAGDRAGARRYADTALDSYCALQTDLAVGAEQYIALVVCMPETVGNEANFRMKVQPSVELGVSLNAMQVEARGRE